jgi:hypothetical protein
MLRQKQSDEDVHVEERDHDGLGVGAIHEPVDVLNLQGRGARASREDRDAAFEPNIGLRDAAKQSLDERIDVLAGLAR